MFGIEKDFQNLMEQVYGPLNKDKMTEIEKTEAEIKVLQKKLELLKEIEKHKSPVEEAYKDWWGQYPELETDSEYDEMRWQGFQAGFQAAQSKDNDTTPSMINCVLEGNPPNGYSYWNEWYKELGSKGILHNLKLSSIDNKTTEPYCPDEPEYYDEVEWDEKDNPKPMDEVVDKLVKEYQYQKLYNRVRDQLGYSIDCCDEIVDLVEDWLPKEHDTNSDGWNKCVRMLRENLR